MCWPEYCLSVRRSGPLVAALPRTSRPVNPRTGSGARDRHDVIARVRRPLVVDARHPKEERMQRRDIAIGTGRVLGALALLELGACTAPAVDGDTATTSEAVSWRKQ